MYQLYNTVPLNSIYRHLKMKFFPFIANFSELLVHFVICDEYKVDNNGKPEVYKQCSGTGQRKGEGYNYSVKEPFILD